MCPHFDNQLCAHLFIVYYSTDSFENLHEKWHPEVKHFCPNVPSVMIGNKSDLRDDEKTKIELQKVRHELVTTEAALAMQSKLRKYREKNAFSSSLNDLFV